MKKVTLLTLAVVIACAAAFAAPVDVTTAKERAEQYLLNKVYSGRIMAPGAAKAKLIKTEMGETAKTPVYYIFNTSTTFVIVSGDDRAEEILAIGDRPLNLDRMPCNMQAWLEGYKKQLDWLLTHPDAKVDKPTTYKSPSVKDDTTYGPLLTALWDQDAPFNNLCHFDYNGTTYECYTGCPATSASMVLYYWKYPVEPVGPIPSYSSTLDLGYWNSVSYTYPALPQVTLDWDNMIDDYTGDYTPEQGAAVATLMRYVGQCEQMMYGTREAGGSGIYTTDTQIIADMYIGFGYDETTCRFVRKSDYTEQQWAAMLQEEIVESRPVVFCGVDNGGAGGHAFNVDGYDPNLNKYHVNFGWSGDGNNWYAMNAFGYSSYTFSDNQRMVLGIQPPIGIITTAPHEVNFEGFAGETYSTTVKVHARNLESDITLELDASSDYSINATTITAQQAAEGYDVTITYSPSTAGSTEATLILSCDQEEVKTVTVPITGMARPRVSTLLVEPLELNFGAILSRPITKSITLTGAFLTGDVTATLTDPNGVFSVTPATIAQSSTDVNTPVQVEVTFNSPREGNFAGTIEFSSPGAQSVTVNLTGAAHDGGTAADPYLNIAKYATIDDAGWNSDDIMNLYNYTEYDDYAWLTLSNYGVIKADATQAWFTNSGNRTGSGSWLATDIFLGSPNYFNGTPFYADWSEDYQTFYVTNCTQVKQLALNKSSSYPLIMSIYECTLNADGSVTPAPTPVDTKQSTVYGNNTPEVITSSTLDDKKIYMVTIYNDFSNLYEIGFQTPLNALERPVATAATEVGARQFVANWQPCEGATSYTLRVKQFVASSLLSETFAGCTTAGSQMIGSMMDDYCDNPGWTGTAAYSAVGGVRLGTGSSTGSITTPAIDLSTTTGKVWVKFTAHTFTNNMGNSDTNCELAVACGDASTTVVVPDGSEQTFVVTLDCQAATGQQLVFSTTARSKRVIITGVEIYDGEPASGTFAQDVFFTGITSCSYKVTGLMPATTYLYDVMALYGTDESHWSNKVDVTTASSTAIAGDVDGDGEVTIADATALYNWLLADDASHIVNGDQDGDGEITAGDVTVVYSILLGADN